MTVSSRAEELAELGEAVAPEAPDDGEAGGRSEEIRDALSASPAEWAAFEGRIIALDLTTTGSLRKARKKARQRLREYGKIRQRIADQGDDFRRLRDNLSRVREGRREIERDANRRGLNTSERQRLEELEAREEELQDTLSDLYTSIGADLEKAREQEDRLARDLLVLERERPSAAIAGDGAVQDPRSGWAPPAERERLDPSELRPRAG